MAAISTGRRCGGGTDRMAAMRRLGIIPECDLTVMAIRAEENISFQVSYIGSRGARHQLFDAALEVRRIDTQRTLGEHIADLRRRPRRAASRARHLDPARLRLIWSCTSNRPPAWSRPAGNPVAICTGIPGNFRYPDARIEGGNDHVGLPRRFRRDAALAGADFSTAPDRLWEEHDAKGIPMACTIGRFYTDPAQHGLTIVPGSFHFSLIVRAYDRAGAADPDARVDAIIAGIEQRRACASTAAPRRAPRSARSPLRSAPEDRGGAAALGSLAHELGSSASHDAAAFAAVGVPMGMIFVRNDKGSHNPHEAMTIDGLPGRHRAADLHAGRDGRRIRRDSTAAPERPSTQYRHQMDRPHHDHPAGSFRRVAAAVHRAKRQAQVQAYAVIQQDQAGDQQTHRPDPAGNPIARRIQQPPVPASATTLR